MGRKKLISEKLEAVKARKLKKKDIGFCYHCGEEMEVGPFDNFGECELCVPTPPKPPVRKEHTTPIVGKPNRAYDEYHPRHPDRNGRGGRYDKHGLWFYD